MKLSIIVPIYNVEKYLLKCVDSLFVQDLQSSEYEIILVDDGSPDRCPDICDQYAAKYDNIRVIHRKNGGLSAARNTGLKVAQGQYVMFVDSDDYVEPNVLGGLMKQVDREDLDVLRIDYQNVRIVKKSSEHERSKNSECESEYEVFEPNKYPHKVDARKDVVNGKTYLDERMGYTCYVMQFIIKRAILPPFTEGIHFEDVDWLPRMMLCANRVNSTTTIGYNYLIRQGSISHVQGNVDKLRKNVEDFMLIIAKYNIFIADHPSCQWLKNMRSSMVTSVIANLAQGLYTERDKYLLRLKEMKVYPLSIADQNPTYKRRARMINVSPRMMVALMHWRNKVKGTK